MSLLKMLHIKCSLNDLNCYFVTKLSFPLFSAEIWWPQNEDGLKIKLKVRQSSSADWFGIGFSTGKLMVRSQIH